MKKEEFKKERTRIISEMLDNPDEYGIYPTTKCFEQLDELYDKISSPPAEDAEEILDKHWNNFSINVKKAALKAMHEFATLHAKRIANKMIENELNNFIDFINDKFCEDITGNMLDKEDVEEFLKSEYYLKSREQ